MVKTGPETQQKGRTKQVWHWVQFWDMNVPEKELNSEEKADLQALLSVYQNKTMQIVKYWELSRCWWLIRKWF